MSKILQDNRCLRCGTILRGHRSACPSCGTELSEFEGHVQICEQGKTPAATAPAPRTRAVQARSGRKICPVCMQSVPEEHLIEHAGQQICTTCHQSLAQKAHHGTAEKTAG